MTAFDRFDALSDTAFAMWVAVRMVAIGLAISVVMVARWAWRRAGRKRRRVAYRDIERLIAVTKANAVYAGPAYWPAMDRLREMWIEREKDGTNGGPA